MRIYPPVSIDEALDWLTKQAAADWRIEITPDLTEKLRPVAAAMAAVSQIVVPEDVEPFAPPDTER
jgi:hypothetical protein